MEIITDMRNAALHKKCEKVQKFDINLLTFLNKLTIKMKKKVGLGLACPQVGMPIRAFVMWRTDDTILQVVNPEILERGKHVTSKNEGCLSIPNFKKNIKRSKRIKVKFKTPLGKVVRLELRNLDAFVFQHELDHLNGILIND